MYTIFSQFGKMHVDILIIVFPHSNRKGAEVSGVGVEKEAKEAVDDVRYGGKARVGKTALDGTPIS
jgi:hypothetical protein